MDPVALSKALRMLWADYASWLRFYFVSAADDLPDQTATLERLLQSQVDIGNAFEPFYG
ncbi:MAG: glycosyltransferase, partial [Chloroflexi bacterium]